MGLDPLIPLFGILLVMIPVLGLTTVLTLRFGLKPFMETIAEHLQGTGFVAPAELERRVEELTAELERVRTDLARLEEGQAFERKLLEPRGGAGREEGRDREAALSLLPAEGFQRREPTGPGCRRPACEERHGTQDGGDGDQDHGIPGLHLEEEARDDPPQRHGPEEPQDDPCASQSEGPSHHQPPNFSGGGPQRHAQPELCRAFVHQDGHDAVDPHRGQQ